MPTHFQMLSGEMLDLEDLNPAQLHPVDLVHGISNISRFAGQVQRPYTTGQHTVAMLRVAQCLPAPSPVYIQRSIFMHDLAEAITGEIPSPAKAMLGTSIRRLELAIDSAIAERFGHAPIACDYKPLDNLMLLAELSVLKGAASTPASAHLEESVRWASALQPHAVRSILAATFDRLFRGTCRWGPDSRHSVP